jgi:hypothetical protein
MFTNGEEPKTKLPVAADAIFNQIALGLAKHQRIAATLSKHRTNTPTTIQIKGRGFSSLATTNGHTPNGTKTSTTQQSSPQTNNGSSGIEDEESLYSASINAGLGFSPSPSPSSSSSAKNNGESKDTAALRRRVLGRNAARQLAEARTAGRKRAAPAEDSESEEEVGKASLVKAGGRRGVRVKEDYERGVEAGKKNGVDASPARKKPRVGGALEEEEEEEGKTDREGEDVAMGDADAGVGEAAGNDGHPGAAQEQLAAEKKMKRNKNNKKKKKKVEAGSEDREASSK